MTTPGPAPHAGSGALFDALMAEVMAGGSRFGHREHVHLTWLACAAAASRQRSAWSATGFSAPPAMRARQKYHATVSRAWVELVGYHAAESGDDDFAAFAAHHRALLDKRLLTRFYRPATLASAQAKTGWAEPDLAPFPWQDPERTGSRHSSAIRAVPFQRLVSLRIAELSSRNLSRSGSCYGKGARSGSAQRAFAWPLARVAGR